LQVFRERFAADLKLLRKTLTFIFTLPNFDMREQYDLPFGTASRRVR